MRKTKTVKQLKKKILKTIKNGRSDKEKISASIRNYINAKRKAKLDRIHKMTKK
jgi:hypothetical protein